MNAQELAEASYLALHQRFGGHTQFPADDVGRTVARNGIKNGVTTQVQADALKIVIQMMLGKLPRPQAACQANGGHKVVKDELPVTRPKASDEVEGVHNKTWWKFWAKNQSSGETPAKTASAFSVRTKSSASELQILSCPTCGTKLKNKPGTAGKNVRCPKCNMVFPVVAVRTRRHMIPFLEQSERWQMAAMLYQETRQKLLGPWRKEEAYAVIDGFRAMTSDEILALIERVNKRPGTFDEVWVIVREIEDEVRRIADEATGERVSPK